MSMNEGAAKAYRRYQLETTGNSEGAPGGAIKDLWLSLNHRQRGKWRRKFGPTRAVIRRAFKHARAGSMLHELSRAYGTPILGICVR